MAIVFLLGPSQWDLQRGEPPKHTPMEARRQMEDLLEAEGHHVILMEDVEDKRDEDLIEKFDRILQTKGVTDIVVYWPAGAKMQTTYDELILLRDRVDDPLPDIWVLHQASVAEISREEFRVTEAGGRSRYLEAVARLGVRPFPWEDHEGLLRLARLLASEL